jgi:hypothetical protein
MPWRVVRLHRIGLPYEYYQLICTMAGATIHQEKMFCRILRAKDEKCTVMRSLKHRISSSRKVHKRLTDSTLISTRQILPTWSESTEPLKVFFVNMEFTQNVFGKMVDTMLEIT